jgi:glycine/D-amino acid oxidase-like deaminating enzyme
MACGMSQILIDLMAGRKPVIDATPFSVARYGR